MIEASKKPVLHLSIHSFTPIWSGVERKVDIGILFDPDNKSEAEL
jgi:predicted N-formylglutamate amidohydrolase